MWNDDEELEQLMLVIEDITEKEKLAHELEEQKKTSEKNITIIKEMAKADLDDITHFLKDAPKLVTNTIGLLRKKTTDPEELTEMFRNLHTLKGNSRIFNFNSISGLTHQAESDVTTIRENNQEGKEIDHEVYTHLMGKLYDIIGEISEYGALAKKVFRIENEFEKKLINDIQDFTSKIDSQINNLITKNELDFMADKPEHVRKEAFDSVKERTITPETIDILKRSAHSLKGSLRSIKKSEATDLVHKFENSFHLFENLNDASLEVFYRDFINNYIEIKDLVKSIYMNSDLNKPSSQSIQDWKELFLTFYQFSLEEKTNKGHKVETRESLKNSIQRLNLKFLTTTLKELEELPDAHENRNILMGEIWRYISFISKINFSKVSDELREEWIPHLMNIPDSPEEAQTLFKEKLKNSKNVLIESLANISRENQSPNYFFQLAQFYMHLQPDDAKAAFFLKKSDTINIKKIGKTLKNTHVVTDLPFQLSKMAQEGDSLALSLSQIIKEGGQHNYLKTIDLNQVVQSFLLNEKGGGKFQVKEMDTLNIISKNYHRLQEAIDKGSNFEDVQKAFEKLMDIPLVNSLSKFEAMVLEISLKLNKRVDFEIGGEEITMNKDSYSILQDAFVHILRNSIDHGIENPDDRKKNGKRPAGNITIQCNELGNDRIEISIKDDGNGINVDRVAEKAIENGIITPDKKDSMDPSEIIDLIFLPNFSQKSEVDELSGRGVGMDIVKKNIESLGGEVKIITTVGKGTEFILTQIKTS
jgi:chemotaxis protein histidine kinase CheA